MRIMIVLCIAVFISACASAPKPDNYKYSVQKKMQSVAHWEMLAKEVVEMQVLPTLGAGQTLNPVYVDQSDPTEFGRAFYNYIVTELVKHNVVLSPSPSGANVVKWGSQLVWNEKQPSGSGILAAALEGLSFILVGSSWVTQPSEVELIITTQVERHPYILSRKSHTYYINDNDKMNFWVAKK